MKRRGFLVAVVVATIGAVVVSSGSAAPTPARPGAAPDAKLDLSTLPAIKAYLRAKGINPAQVVVQRGSRNYAGARCPGKRWNCTTARRVIQISTTASAVNQSQCSGTLVGQSCTVVQTGPGDNHARCHLKTTAAPTATQTCDITQSSVTGDNRAHVHMTIRQTAGSTQDATQTASIDQTSTSGDNHAVWHMDTDQDEKTGLVQAQDGEVLATVSQDTQSGDNHSTGHQSLTERQRARATGAAAIQQCQNGDGDSDGNDACFLAPSDGKDVEAEVDQTTASGVNHSTLHQQNRMRQDAHAAAGDVQQTQGIGFFGGLGGDVNQSSPVDSKSNANQQKDYDQKAKAKGFIGQNQLDGINCCSTQTGPGTVDINQRSTLTQKPGGDQSLIIVATCDTLGNCKTSSTGKINDDQETRTCEGTSCFIVVECTNTPPEETFAAVTPFSRATPRGGPPPSGCTSFEGGGG